MSNFGGIKSIFKGGGGNIKFIVEFYYTKIFYGSGRFIIRLFFLIILYIWFVKYDNIY